MAVGVFAWPSFSGLMLYKHFGVPFMPGYSDYAMKRFESETGIRAEGTDPALKREWLVDHKLNEYHQWWFAKEREFLLALRDRLQALRPHMRLYYYPWHSDDDAPICGRLRFPGLPIQDKIYVPGTSILLDPGFTKRQSAPCARGRDGLRRCARCSPSVVASTRWCRRT